jgi:hypothetical protein
MRTELPIGMGLEMRLQQFHLGRAPMSVRYLQAVPRFKRVQ